MNCEAISKIVAKEFIGGFRCTRRSHQSCRILTPLCDPNGDPIQVRVRMDGEQVVIDDLGQVSGALFSLDQDSEASPGFQLVRSLAHAHGIALDFDKGILFARCVEEELAKKFLSFLTVVVSIQTSLPHVRSRKRERESLGPRLARAFGLTLVELRVLADVKRHCKVAGASVDDWIIDYLYRTKSTQYDVLISTVDLDVASPRSKAEHAITMALDLRSAHQGDKIRILYDTHGRNSDTAHAAELIRAHQEHGYEAFDFRRKSEIADLRTRVLQELSPADSQWQEAFR